MRRKHARLGVAFGLGGVLFAAGLMCGDAQAQTSSALTGLVSSRRRARWRACWSAPRRKARPSLLTVVTDEPAAVTASRPRVIPTLAHRPPATAPHQRHQRRHRSATNATTPRRRPSSVAAGAAAEHGRSQARRGQEPRPAALQRRVAATACPARRELKDFLTDLHRLPHASTASFSARDIPPRISRTSSSAWGGYSPGSTPDATATAAARPARRSAPPTSM